LVSTGSILKGKMYVNKWKYKDKLTLKKIIKKCALESLMFGIVKRIDNVRSWGCIETKWQIIIKTKFASFMPSNYICI
jgi:hypothetical protein